MTRRRRGRESEILLAQYLNDSGFDVRAQAASVSGSDVVGIEGIDFEVKSRRNIDFSGLLAQMERRRHETGLGIGVMRLNGQGEKSIGSWVAILRMDDIAYLLKAAGYGKR